MRLTVFVSIASLFLTCCSAPSPRQDGKHGPEAAPGERFFDYDEIVYYSGDFKEERLPELTDDTSNSSSDSLKNGLYLGSIPQNVSDTAFLTSIEQLEFRKTALHDSTFSTIDEIFSEKQVDEILSTSCIQIYRDILVFRKKKKVVGVAKICFDCLGFEIVGTRSNTAAFGQDGDSQRLKAALQKQEAPTTANR